MKFTLEDMTKEELIKLFQRASFYLPSQKDMGWIRWESMCEKAQALMVKSIKEQEEYTGKTDIDSHSKWLEASKKFEEGMKLSDKADAFLEELKAMK